MSLAIAARAAKLPGCSSHPALQALALAANPSAVGGDMCFPHYPVGEKGAAANLPFPWTPPLISSGGLPPASEKAIPRSLQA
eukprot:11741968-Alexandrium_andersonii.AAC.1